MLDKAKFAPGQEFSERGDGAPKEEDETGKGDQVEQVRQDIETMGDDVIAGKIGVLEAASRMGELVRSSLKQTAERFAERLQVAPSDLPFSIFVFGSPARDMMMPGSDIDIGLIFRDDCPPEIKEELRGLIRAMPFEKIDIAKWQSLDAIRKENCPHMIEYTNAIEARFVAGNTAVAAEREKIVEGQDGREDKEKRFLTVYNLFHKYNYRTKASQQGKDLKYDFGATRDIIFLDWFLAIDGQKGAEAEGQPAAFACLDKLERDGVLPAAEKKEVQEAIELVLLVKTALWRRGEKTGDQSLSCANDSSLGQGYEDLQGLLKKRGIGSLDEFMYAHNRAKGKIHALVEKLYGNVASRQEEAADWWKTAKEKTVLDEEVMAILKNPGWNELVPFAVSSTSPEVLQYIVKRFSDTPGFEYILRIISENPYITDDIRKDLLASRLDKKFKAKLDK